MTEFTPRWFTCSAGPIPWSLNNHQQIAQVLTPEAAARLEPLTTRPTFGPILARALRQWKAGIPIRRGIYGVTTDLIGFRPTTYNQKCGGCCLLGAAFIGTLSDDHNRRPFHPEVRSPLIFGFDAEDDIQLDEAQAHGLGGYGALGLEAVNFAHEVALAAGLPFNAYPLADGTFGSPHSAFTMIYRPWSVMSGRIPYQVIGFMRPPRKFPGLGLPGGKVEPGESAVRAAIREAREEIGAVWDAREMAGLGMWSHRGLDCSTWFVPANRVQFLAESEFEFTADTHRWLAPEDFAGPDGAFPDWGAEMVEWFSARLSEYGELPWWEDGEPVDKGPGSAHYRAFMAQK